MYKHHLGPYEQHMLMKALCNRANSEQTKPQDMINETSAFPLSTNIYRMGLSANEIALYLFLGASSIYMQIQGTYQATVSLESMATATGCSLRRSNRALTKLISLGMVLEYNSPSSAKLLPFIPYKYGLVLV
jgi:hypothetical protein